jgi:hypothetical protein
VPTYGSGIKTELINARVSRMLILNVMVFFTDLDLLFKSQLGTSKQQNLCIVCIIFTRERILFNNSTLIIWASTLARKVNFEKKKIDVKLKEVLVVVCLSSIFDVTLHSTHGN